MLTKIDIYVIINKNKYITGQTKDIVTGCPQNKTDFKYDKVCAGRKKMAEFNDLRELHTDLQEIANYFIELFKITGEKYSCSRTKLGKLISIVAFMYAIKGEKLFDEKIYKYKTDSSDESCGTVIQELVLFVGRDAYLQKEYNQDEDQIIPSTELNGCEEINSPLSDKLKKNIEGVFLRFGAYNPKILGDCINPIFSCQGIVLEDDSINLYKLQELSKSNFIDFDYNLGDNNVRKDLIDYLMLFCDNHSRDN